MQVQGNERRLGGTDQPPLPPRPPGPVPGPGGPVVTVPNAEQLPMGFVYAWRPSIASALTVSFSFDLTVVANPNGQGVHVDLIETLLFSGVKSIEQMALPLPEVEIVYKRSSPRPEGAWRLRGDGAIVVASNYFDGNAHRTWTLALRARSLTGSSDATGGSRVVQHLLISLPVMGNTPPFLTFSEHP